MSIISVFWNSKQEVEILGIKQDKIFPYYYRNSWRVITVNSSLKCNTECYCVVKTYRTYRTGLQNGVTERGYRTGDFKPNSPKTRYDYSLKYMIWVLDYQLHYHVHYPLTQKHYSDQFDNQYHCEIWCCFVIHEWFICDLALYETNVSESDNNWW